MQRLSGLFLLVATFITSFLSVSCVDVTSLSPWEVVSGLSDIVLEPEGSCEELRRAFGLEGILPLADNPGQIGLDYEEHWLPTVDGEVLRTWYMPTKLDRGLVIVSSGAVGPMTCQLYTARLLARNGWSVVLYEYEGFGESSGQPDLETLGPNLETVVDWALGYTDREQATLMGISLGSIPSVTVAVERPGVANGVILDSPVAFGTEIERFGFIVGGQTGAVIGQLSPGLVTDTMIRWLDAPLLVFLHERDTVTTPASVEMLYELAPTSDKLLVRFPDLGHVRGQFFDTDLYTFSLESFLSRVWPGDVEIVSERG